MAMTVNCNSVNKTLHFQTRIIIICGDDELHVYFAPR